MIKTFQELREGLETLYPVMYNHFTSNQEGIYLVYVDNGQDDIYGDDLVSVERYLIDIDLNTPTKDLVAERKIKDFFRANDLVYEKSDTIYLQEEESYLTTFSIELINAY